MASPSQKIAVILPVVPTGRQESPTISSTTTSILEKTSNSSHRHYNSAKYVVICLLLIAAAWAVYGETARHAFVNYDDFEYVVDNPRVRNGLTWSNVYWAFTTDYFCNWHPLTWLSHMLDVQLFGLRAAGHHLTSVFFHSVNALLVFGILLAMTGALWRSAIVAAIFVVHPINIESVAWIAERKTVLCALFGFLTIWAYVKYARKHDWKHYFLVILLYTLSLMAKPMLVTMPFLLLLLDIWSVGRLPLASISTNTFSLVSTFSEACRLLREKVPLLILSVLSCVVTLVVQKSGGAVMDLATFPFRHRVENSMVSYVTYIEKLFWPLRLALFYPHHDFSTSTVVGSTFALIGITGLAISVAKKRPYFIVGWLWYVGSLFPAIGIVQAGEQAMADRYAYIPMIGIAIMIVWGTADIFSMFPKVKLAAPTLAGLAIFLLILTSQTQVRYWNNSVVLWAHSLEITTNNHIAHANLGTALGSRGRYSEAIVELTRAIEICPNFAEAHNSLGAILARTGRLDEAANHFSTAIQYQPKLTKARNNLAKSFAERGRTNEAINEYREVIRIDPADEMALEALKTIGLNGPTSNISAP